MKKITALLSAFLLFANASLFAATAEEYAQYKAYEGKKIGEINIKTNRVFPSVVKAKFLLKTGDTFTYETFDNARQALHNMRIFKTLDVNVEEQADGNLKINIDGKDSYFVLPLIVGSTGGSKGTGAFALVEQNLFRLGEATGLVGAFSQDGYVIAGGALIKDTVFFAGSGRYSYEEDRYEDGSYNTSGLFTTGELTDINGLENSYDVDRTNIFFGLGRSFSNNTMVGVGFKSEVISYADNANTTEALPSDEGRHAKIFAIYRRTLNSTEGRQSSLGAVTGLGLSDKNDRMKRLPYIKPGYALTASYQGGGEVLGSDFDTSKIKLSLGATVELKTRHKLYANIHGVYSFTGDDTPLFDSVRSKDVLNRWGKYPREFRGEKGFGIGTAFNIYLLKSNLGLLSFEPFVETGFIWDADKQYNTTGTGAKLYFTFWRFPLPIGFNYTNNLSNRDQTISFFIGG
jgi:hypothetical protein